jgi:TatD DNase family protein
MSDRAPFLIDTHAHLDADAFGDDRDAVIERAAAARVEAIITIGAGFGAFATAERAIALSASYRNLHATAGIHPHDASVDLDIPRLEALCRHERIVAVGETGLDYFKGLAPRERQETWFRAQIQIARRVKKPVIIHSRDAGEDCLRILLEEGAEAVGGVFHCYQEDAQFARRLREIGFLVSFPGTLTFKKAALLRERARDIPLDQIMLETDAPYMAPEPYRGKRCESAYVREIASVLAQVKGMSLEEVAMQTTKNACKLFNLPYDTEQ